MKKSEMIEGIKRTIDQCEQYLITEDEAVAVIVASVAKHLLSKTTQGPRAEWNCCTAPIKVPVASV